MDGGSLLTGMSGSLSSAEGGSPWNAYTGIFINAMSCSLKPLFAVNASNV